MNLQKTGTNYSKAYNAANSFTAILFIIYLIAIWWILLFKLGVRFSYMAERRTNFVPFSRTLILSSENILNVVIFLPLGIYTRILFERWMFGKKLLFFFFISFLIEVLQYTLRIGAFDVTDIITNTLGAIIGLLIYKGLEKAFNNKVVAQKFTNTLAAMGTVLMILLLALLKMNMLPVKYR